MVYGVPDPERDERARDEAPRQPEDAGHHQAMPFVAAGRVAGIVRDPREVEAEEIAAVLLRSAQRVGHAVAVLHASSAAVGLVHLNVEPVEPGLPSVGIGHEDVRVARDRQAAGAIGPARAEDEGEQVPAAGARIGHRRDDTLEALAHAERPLIRTRRLRVVGDQEHLGIGRAALRDDRLETGHAQIRRIPDDGLDAVADAAVARELERAASRTAAGSARRASSCRARDRSSAPIRRRRSSAPCR